MILLSVVLEYSNNYTKANGNLHHFANDKPNEKLKDLEPNKLKLRYNWVITVNFFETIETVVPLT